MTRTNPVPRPRASILFQPLEDGGVLFCTKGEVYFGLNPVGVEIWTLLAECGADLECLVDRLLDRYPDTPPETVRADVREFLAELSSAGLLAA